jgi:hypothetical protein
MARSIRYAGVIASCLACLALNCARGIPKPAGVAPGTPYVTWVLMSGDRDNPDRDFVCQSDQSTECVVPASRPDEQVFSDAHFYYHGVGADIRYVGSIRIGYFRVSSDGQQIQTNMAVKKSDTIVNQSVVGIVTDTPGNYEIIFNLTAGPASGGANSREIRERLPIVVTAH